MRILPFILLLAFVGCDRSEPDLMLRKTSAEVQQWVPMGTTLAVARQAMEQHQYGCSASSYDSVEQMQRERPATVGEVRRRTHLLANLATQPLLGIYSKIKAPSQRTVARRFQKAVCQVSDSASRYRLLD
jgi:hypothetical protein